MTKYSQPDSLLETVLQVNMSRSRFKNSEPGRISGLEMPVFQLEVEYFAVGSRYDAICSLWGSRCMVHSISELSVPTPHQRRLLSGPS